MALASSTSSRGPQIKWNHDMRLALHLLHDERLGFDSKGKADIFNALFSDHLHECGFVQQGVTWRRLGAQYNERFKPSAARRWESIIPPHEGDIALRQELKERIDALASDRPTGLRKTAVQQAPGVREPQPSDQVGGYRRTSSRQRRPTKKGVRALSRSPSPSPSPCVPRIGYWSPEDAIHVETRALKKSPYFNPAVVVNLDEPVKKAKRLTSRTLRSPRKERATEVYKRGLLCALNVTPEEKMNAMGPLIYPPQHQAQPRVTGLFFRQVSCLLCKKQANRQ